MTSLAADLLLDGFSRVQQGLHHVVAGLSPEQLRWSPDPEANTIAWLGWHLARVQDDHLAGIGGDAGDGDQVWLADGWEQRFGLPFEPNTIGYGQTSAQAHQVGVSGELLTGYYDAVSEHTRQIVSALSADDFARVVDERWDPPVTAAVRLVSVLNDVTQHIGQAAYIKGLLPPA